MQTHKLVNESGSCSAEAERGFFLMNNIGLGKEKYATYSEYVSSGAN
jgi:hypothetical protein